ncbi:hypothetical protein ANCCEY_00482 [Ancylostoma ceylanicum]|uniref:Peptidase family M13 n=1 Tax=Ancylostoma ceylanicum TaxID=53326 RepID=A0A0D6M8F7_9BILA|nr:hypothetical protein ANCCEY_00482 [Ancylostoma ceylanicum]
MLKKDAEDVAEFDHLLAMKYCSDDLSRKELERVYNPMTFPQMKQRYPNIDWVMLLTETTQLAPNVTRRILADPNYQFIVMEPEMLQRLSDALGESSKFVSPRTVVNYIYSQLLAAYSSFLPIPMMDSNNPNNNLTILEHIPTKTRPPPPRPRSIWPERPIYKQQQYDDEQAAQFSCAAESINTLKYANGRMFIDKIYPTQKSRKELRENVGKMISGILVGFRSMIDQLNWMTPASKLGAYKKIDHLVKNIGYPDWITDDEKLTKSYEKVIAWKIGDHWNMLFDRSPDREDFSAPLGSANAWYQPQLNSITLPASILHSPFYHPDLPTAVNFGAMGMIVGHELTHGFDDMGVQWDGLGVLDGWMDYPSEVGFRQMADCVVEEYGRFCPFNKTEHGDVACVDGAATQGENIADNGGIRAAFRAYRNHINLHGPDPQLPDEQLQEFTSDQLFFMSFAQIWCQVPDDEASLRSQLMFDVHSPSMYRVWGTIQNFPAFKDAFHCPSSPYAPDKHCDVWVSEPDSSHGEPVVKTELNVRQNEPISPNNFEEYSAYKVAADYYKESVNTSVDPCTDFFQYACGKYDKPVSFGVGRAKIDENIAKKLYSPEYDATIKSSKALTKGKSFIDACVETAKDSSKNQQILATENYLLPRVNKLANYLGSNFTYVFGGEVSHRPDKTQLANALGHRHVRHANGRHKLAAAQGGLHNVSGPEHCIHENLRIDETKLKDDIRGLIEFEQMIALSYSTDDDTRRTYSRSWNPVDIEWLAEYSFVDWKVYMKQVPNVAQEVVQMPTFMVSVSEPEQLEKMTRDYGTWDQTKLVNYLFMRLVLSNAQYLPSYASGFDEMPSNTVEDTQLHCVGLANQLMPYAIGRVYIDYEYPDNNKKQLIRKTTGNMMQNIIHSFQGMLDSLDWMTQKTKRKALEKTLDIVQNIAFPDWIMDNQKLDDYYKDIDFNVTQENYYDMWTKLIVFNIALVYKQLTAKEADRRDFLGQPATVNAWYMVGHELIHGFDDQGVQWGPGGEMSLPSCGECTGWMDKNSTAGFKAMAECVIDEYNKFCPLDPSQFTPNCVNGANTQGENIADNGGIHTAFRAYRTHIALNGPDPLLPDRLFGQFTHDQLFFLSFAQVWCENRRSDDRLYQQLMVDPHSPAMYRVFGTIQNYPAFREAYNCPLETQYAPEQHCNVWVPNNTS